MVNTELCNSARNSIKRIDYMNWQAFVNCIECLKEENDRFSLANSKLDPSCEGQKASKAVFKETLISFRGHQGSGDEASDFIENAAKLPRRLNK